MKKFFVVMLLCLGTLVYAETREFTSLAYIEISTNKLYPTSNQGGDGYYAWLKIDNTKQFALFYFVDIRDNRIVGAFTEIGILVDVATTETTYVTRVNDHKYVFSFRETEEGRFMLMAPEVVEDTLFIFEAP